MNRSLNKKNICKILDISPRTLERAGVHLGKEAYRKEVVFTVVLRFIASFDTITEVILARTSYNIHRWSVREGLKIPKEITKLAQRYDPVHQKVRKFPKRFFIARSRNGELIRTELLPQSTEPPDP